MTLNPKNGLKVLEFYYRFIDGKTSIQQAGRIKNETNTAVFHYVLPEFGFERDDYSQKMTAEETNAAKAVLKGISIQSLSKMRGSIQRSFAKLKVSPSRVLRSSRAETHVKAEMLAGEAF